MLTTPLFALEIKFVLKIASNPRGISWILYYKTNRQAFKKWGETLDYVSCFSLHFFRALAASCVLYNRTEHSQGFSIC